MSHSSIPLQKISQKGVDRSVENPQKRAENIKMAPNAPNKFSWRMRNKMPLCYADQFFFLEMSLATRHSKTRRYVKKNEMSGHVSRNQDNEGEGGGVEEDLSQDHMVFRDNRE